MGIPKEVAKSLAKYHLNAIDVCNVLNTLGMLKDEKARQLIQNHTDRVYDWMQESGLDIKGTMLNELKEG